MREKPELQDDSTFSCSISYHCSTPISSSLFLRLARSLPRGFCIKCRLRGTLHFNIGDCSPRSLSLSFSWPQFSSPFGSLFSAIAMLLPSLPSLLLPSAHIGEMLPGRHSTTLGAIFIGRQRNFRISTPRTLSTFGPDMQNQVITTSFLLYTLRRPPPLPYFPVRMSHMNRAQGRRSRRR